MRDLNFLRTLLSVSLGWLLAEAGFWLRARREDRRAIGRALTNLLLVRERLYMIRVMTRKLQTLVAADAHEILKMQHFLDSFLPDFPGLKEQYEEALKTLSGSRPLLAESLYKQVSLDAIRNIRQLLLADRNAAEFLSKMSARMEDPTILDSAIRNLGWLHGLRTWLKISSRLRQAVTMPTELERLFDEQVARMKT